MDYHANCYLHVYDVSPNNVRFNDGNCNHISSAYLCQKMQKSTKSWLGKPSTAKCATGSPGNCKITVILQKGYSPGPLIRVFNGIKVKKSTEKDSCPTGWKIWSPRNKKDWTLVYNVMGKNIKNYPQKPHLLVDVTRPANSCGGCTKYAMKSSSAYQASWKTKDGSAWWLRDAKYNEPNGDYHANCYLHVYDVNPNNVRFNDGSCGYSSSDYLCQPAKQQASIKCRNGSPKNCVVDVLNQKGYSATYVLRVRNGLKVKKSTDTDSCPKNWKIWSPRNKNDWITVYNALGKKLPNYPQKPHLLVDVTRPANSCGGCTKYAMKSTTA